MPASAAKAIVDHGACPDRTPGKLHIPEVPTFYGRHKELELVRRDLWSETKHPVALVPASAGAMHGVGKTAIAAEYASRHAHLYAGICWIDASQPKSIPHQLIAAAQRLAPTIRFAANLQHATEQAISQLSRGTDSTPLLVVFDGLDDIEHATSVLPGGLYDIDAHLLVTSICCFWPTNISRVNVDVYPTEIAANILLQAAPSSTAAEAASLALQLGYLPLAVHQAASYCRQVSIGCAEYARIASQWTNDSKPARGNSPVLVTTALALEQLRAHSPNTQAPLETLATLGPSPMDAQWLINSPTIDLIENGHDFEQTLEILLGWALISRQLEDNQWHAVHMHPLIQSAICTSAESRNNLTTALDRAAKLVSLKLDSQPHSTSPPKNQPELDWQRCATFLPQALWLLTQAATNPFPASAGLSKRVEKVLELPEIQSEIGTPPIPSHSGISPPAKWHLAGWVLLGVAMAAIAGLLISDPERAWQFLTMAHQRLRS